MFATHLETQCLNSAGLHQVLVLLSLPTSYIFNYRFQILTYSDQDVKPSMVSSLNDFTVIYDSGS